MGRARRAGQRHAWPVPWTHSLVAPCAGAGLLLATVIAMAWAGRGGRFRGWLPLVLPSWRLYDDVGPRIELQLRIRCGAHWGPWEPAWPPLPGPRSPWFDPASTLAWARQTAVDHLVAVADAEGTAAHRQAAARARLALMLAWARVVDLAAHAADARAWSHEHTQLRIVADPGEQPRTPQAELGDAEGGTLVGPVTLAGARERALTTDPSARVDEARRADASPTLGGST
jgi:hypothetical protein